MPFRPTYGGRPDRMIWGSDWPHVNWRKRMMNDAETVELLYRYVDNDPCTAEEDPGHQPGPPASLCGLA